MLDALHPPLREPKNRHTLEAIAVCRVSDPKPGKQDERSLGDQEASYRQWLDRKLNGQPYHLTVIAGSGSGELLDRAEYQRLIELVATRRYDLVLTEDLGRIIRRIHAHLVCEHCEDFETRLYAINDHVDTGVPGWREASIFAAFHHERSNRDTSDRIKRTHRNRFQGGGCLRQAAYGWIKPLGAKNDAELTKDPAAEAIYTEWFRMLDEDAATFADVARWLRTRHIPFPSRTRGRFNPPDGKSVARHTFNVLLKGTRERNRRTSKRINNSGKYVSVKAQPLDLLVRKVSHLAFFEEAYFDRVVAKVKARNACFRRTDDPAADPCLNRPRKQTRCPGRITFCGVCGRPFVWGGHGQTDHMMCTGARGHQCWNGVTFDGPIAVMRIAAAVLAEVEKLEGFDAAFLESVKDEASRLDQRREERLKKLLHEIQQVDSEIINIVDFVKGGKALESLSAELEHLERRKAVLSAELADVRQAPVNAIEIPAIDTVKQLARTCLTELAKDSPEFAVILRKLVPRVVVFPFRLCDGGGIVLRAKFRVYLANLLPDRRSADLLRRPLERILPVDLFDKPQREEFRERIVAARVAGSTEREAAVAFGLTVTAAQRASALQRAMNQLAITDPYLPVRQPPDDCPKLRRHRHPDYRFDPLPGAGEV